jgi:hypothetical protein
MHRFIEGEDRMQPALLPHSLDRSGPSDCRDRERPFSALCSRSDPAFRPSTEPMQSRLRAFGMAAARERHSTCAMVVL